VSLADAVLGGTITVPTIHGDVAMKVPKGSNSGSTLRLRGKGIAGGGTSGDHYVKMHVMLPDPPDPELTTLLEIWAQRQGSKMRGAG
jgi:DnaJ-class molecular chaperone